MSKGFDRLEWPFLLSILSRLGFHADWIKMIEQCISTTNISLLINGSPSATFAPSRGVRQEDPLSPYIFLFVMESLSRFLQQHVDFGHPRGIQINKHCPAINHLFFADDCLLFFQASPTHMRHLQYLLTSFGQASCQVINMQKSTIFFSKHSPPAHKNNIINILQMKCMGLGEKYLGIPLLMHRSRQKNCQGILDNMNSRLRGWHSKLIPQEGKTTHLNSVLSTMGMYQMQVFKLHDTTISHMNRIQRQYWWHNYTNHKSPRVISWDNVSLPKKLGGLGLKNLKNYNSVFLAKLAWNLLHNQDILCARILKGKYFSFHDLRYHPPPLANNGSWIWQSIVHGLHNVLKQAKWQIGNGTTINIWTHNWIPDLNSPLQDWYDLHLSNYQWVSQLIDTSSSQWNVPLLRQLFTSSQVDSILTIPIQLDQQDSLVWPLTAAGIFTTKSTYHHLCESQHSVAVATTLSTKFWLKFWKLHIPYKFQLFLWKIFQNYLPVKTKLFHQNILTSSYCVLYNNNQLESVDHLMYHRPFNAAICRYFIPQLYQDLIIHSITNYLHFHHLTLSNNIVIPVRNNLILDISWQPPPPAFLKINIDASFHPNFNLAEIGILIRDHAGRFVASKGALKRTHNAFQAEAWALVEGMNLAMSHGWHQVIFESDNLNMCRFVQQQHHPPPWRNLPLLKSCINMCNNSSLAWSCNHVYRCCIKAADALAKAVISGVVCSDHVLDVLKDKKKMRVWLRSSSNDNGSMGLSGAVICFAGNGYRTENGRSHYFKASKIHNDICNSNTCETARS
ncbi:uncharacterized protein LOC113296326 [Papaver somniferum]|uniref:uncharacterized protein LOC113296326 n=1 Tax=Papaver somniferum TaxID=3469 RepID=UPI000E701D3E|nr:uncharacterized protein LOC113296326 [Papaver somniferum]